MATRKIHFFTGKGGVGKSTLAAAYADYLSSAFTQKILLSELAERSFYNHFFAATSGSANINSLKFDITQWSPNSCLREYALHLLKIESLYKLFFENPVSKSLIQVAPGLQELAILGKATSAPRQHGPPTIHDEVVLDSFSTGHFLNLLRAPKAMSEIISFGPMAEQSRSIDRWIRNSDFTQIHIVTTAENYAVTETLELAEKIDSEFKLQPKLYLNKTFSLDQSALTNADPVLVDLTDQENAAREQLKKSGFTVLETPLDVAENNFDLVKNLSQKMASQQ